MAEQFVKLTHFVSNQPILVRVSAIRYIATGNEDGASLCFDANEFTNVRESPAEALSLLAPGAKAEGIPDVVEKLRVDIVAWNRHVRRGDWCVLDGKSTVSDLERLVAYFDGGRA